MLHMANIKANKKSVRQTAARAARNKIVRTRLKTLVKGFTAGVIHRNKANRIKARLAKKLAAAKK